MSAKYFDLVGTIHGREYSDHGQYVTADDYYHLQLYSEAIERLKLGLELELENFKANILKWTEREIKLIADKCLLEEKIEVLQADLNRMTEGRDGLRLALDEANKTIAWQRDERDSK